MCFKSSAPKAPPVVAAPNSDDTQSAVVKERKKLGSAQGVYGNIFTSVLGDSTYGSNATGRPQLATTGV